MKVKPTPSSTGLRTQLKEQKPSKRIQKCTVTKDNFVKYTSGEGSNPLIDLAGDGSGQEEDDSDPVQVSRVTHQKKYVRDRAVNDQPETDRFFITTISLLITLVFF